MSRHDDERHARTRQPGQTVLVRGLGRACVYLVAATVAVSAGGCARAKAKTVPDSPPLEMPPPPERDIEVTESEPPPPVSLPQEPARTATPRPRPVTPSREPPREAPKVEPPKTDVPPIVEAPKPPEEPPKPPVTTLQTTPPTAEGEVERQIRVALQRASNDLNRVDYRTLNSDARTQYDTAKGFIRGAESAVRAKNLLYAKNLADKAAALAAQLGGR